MEVLLQPYNMKCDVNIRKNMCANAVLSSGTNMFHEVSERMTKELTTSTPRKNVYANAVLSSARVQIHRVKFSAESAVG